MSLHPAHNRPAKSVAEHGACFGLAVAMLLAAAVGIQWVLHLVP
jgi:hypothetical protein